MNWTALSSASASHLRRSEATILVPAPFAYVGKTFNLAEITSLLQVDSS
jgi:hypothetical protein